MSHLRFCRATLTRDSDARQTNFPRMDDDSFSILLQRIAPTIQRQDTVLRKTIPVEETKRYLATGTQLINMVTSLTTSCLRNHTV